MAILSPARRTPVSLLMLALAIAWSAASMGCRRRAPGTCGEDLDCAPGFDCRAGTCMRRERLRFGDRGGDEPGPDATSSPSSPSTRDAGTDDAAVSGGAGKPPRREPVRAKPPDPPQQPGAPSSPAPPPGREPMWKQRLKNT